MPVCLFLLLSPLLCGMPANASTLHVWSGGAEPGHVQSWTDRAAAEGWAVSVVGPETSVVKRALAQGRLDRSLLRPRDAVELALLGKALDAEWVLRPGPAATLVSVATLQAASLTLTESAETDRQGFREAVRSMSRMEARAGQLEMMASRWIALGQADRALESLFKAQEKEPNRAMTLALLVDAYRAKGETGEARRYLRMAMKQHRDDPRLLRSAGELELALGRPREALEFFDRATSGGSPTPALYRRIGEAHLALGRNRQAEDALRLASAEPGVSALLARLLAKRGEYRQAAEHAARALEEDPGDAEMRFLLARSTSAGQRYAQAVRDRATSLAAAAEADSVRPLPLSLLQSALRDQLADTINAIRQAQLGGADRTLLYAAAQESVIAADRLRSALQGRPEWREENVSGKQRVLALTLWSQGTYDLVKALESPVMAGLNEPGEILHDALRQLDEAQKGGRRLSNR